MRLTKRRLAVATALVASAVLVTPLSATGTPGTASTVPQLDWQDCGVGYQCTSAKVPLDYAHPNDDHISLSLIRLPATDPARRIGTLFVGPGGPGDSGVTFLRDFASARNVKWFTPEVRARFDLVSYDPRGVGQSSPLHCFATTEEEQKHFANIPPFPVTLDEATRTITTNAAFGAACQRRAPKLASHVSTADVARDLDLLRQAVGDPKITYYGYSYGTYVGETYANMFPNNIRAIGIDGVVQPVEWVGDGVAGHTIPMDVRLQSDTGAYATVQAFLRECDLHPTACGFADGDSARKFATLMKQLRGNPRKLADGTVVTYADAVATTQRRLYTDLDWPQLADYLEGLWTGKGTTTAAPNAITPPAPYPNFRDSNAAITCGETNNPRDPYTWFAAGQQRDTVAPYFGSSWAWMSAWCSTWPIHAIDQYTGPWNHLTSAPILVVGNLRDPATPYEAAVQTSQLMPGSRLLTVDASAHTSLFISSACVASIQTAYLINGTLPPEGTVCHSDLPPFTPPHVASTTAPQPDPR